MISPIEVAFVTACTALLSSFVAPMITLRMARAQIRASVVSNNRQRWIDALRDLIASFCAQIQAAVPIRTMIMDERGALIIKDHEKIMKLEEVMKTLTKIRLMTNPHEQDHQALVATLAKGLSTFRAMSGEGDLEARIAEIVQEAVHISQGIFKREWERVKRGD